MLKIDDDIRRRVAARFSGLGLPWSVVSMNTDGTVNVVAHPTRDIARANAKAIRFAFPLGVRIVRA